MDSRERSEAADRLRVLELVEAALGRRDEVFRVVDQAADPEEAEERVRELFGVHEPHIARAVLDLQVRRWTSAERASVAAETTRLRELLEEPSDRNG